MSKKLYRATCKVEVFFVAESPDTVSDFEIEEYAEQEWRNNGASIGHVREVKDIKTVPSEWINAAVYGDDEDRSCAQILGGKTNE